MIRIFMKWIRIVRFWGLGLGFLHGSRIAVSMLDPSRKAGGMWRMHGPASFGGGEQKLFWDIGCFSLRSNRMMFYYNSTCNLHFMDVWRTMIIHIIGIKCVYPWVWVIFSVRM